MERVLADFRSDRHDRRQDSGKLLRQQKETANDWSHDWNPRGMAGRT